MSKVEWAVTLVMGVLIGLLTIGVIYIAVDLVRAERCSAFIEVYEDGTWSGTELRYGDVVLDRAWDKNIRQWGWRPQVNGDTTCKLVLIRP